MPLIVEKWLLVGIVVYIAFCALVGIVGYIIREERKSRCQKEIDERTRRREEERIQSEMNRKKWLEEVAKGLPGIKDVYEQRILAQTLVCESPEHAEAAGVILERAHVRIQAIKAKEKEIRRQKALAAKAEGKDICEYCYAIEPPRCTNCGHCLRCEQKLSSWSGPLCRSCDDD